MEQETIHLIVTIAVIALIFFVVISSHKAFSYKKGVGEINRKKLEKKIAMVGDEREKNEGKKQAQLPNLDLVAASKIAISVTELFNRDELFQITDALESDEELEEAIRIIHKKLRPNYEQAVKDWYINENQIDEDKLSSQNLKSAIDEAMDKGLVTLQKSQDIQKLFHKEPSGDRSRAIEKRKSWSEIKDQA